MSAGNGVVNAANGGPLLEVTGLTKQFEVRSSKGMR